MLANRVTSPLILVHEALRPYPEGNLDLWMLHHLDIVRKRRAALDVRALPIQMSMMGWLREGDFKPIVTAMIQVGEESVLGLPGKGRRGRGSARRSWPCSPKSVIVGRLSRPSSIWHPSRAKSSHGLTTPH